MNKKRDPEACVKKWGTVLEWYEELRRILGVIISLWWS
jgi:hypothetical protein